MKIQNAYNERMAAQLRAWGAEIDVLEARVRKIGADLNVLRRDEILDLRVRQNAASEQLKKLDKATGEAWTEVKVTADKVWLDLKTGLAAAHSKFK